RFDILDDRERITGQIAYDKLEFRFMKVGDSVVRTPWGDGTVGWKDGMRVTLRGRELFAMSGSLLKTGFQMTSPLGTELTFHPIRGRKNDIQYIDEKGYIAVLEEKGQLTAPMPGRPLPLTPQELKAIPKDRRPHSVESLDYIQYRIKVAGTLPAPQEDIVAALAMFSSFGCLLREVSV
ncbi:MAG: hypothetical protein JW880_05390, partial [Candidatus Thermoplasmatota archaeon]|nr:hypothetical protein [Candidatus Thermoplasmatota archaeon]